MKVYQFDGSYELEVIAAGSEDEAWEHLQAHCGTGYGPNEPEMDYLKSCYKITNVWDFNTLTEPTCLGHYSG